MSQSLSLSPNPTLTLWSSAQPPHVPWLSPPQVLRDFKLPRAIKYGVVAIMAGIWKWYYYAPNLNPDPGPDPDPDP